MAAYYNEIDPFAAAWLRELIKAGVIAPGLVDERPIQEVKPKDVEGYTQCHFFAGIGVWSYALRLAGVSDDTRVWTGSCPCQPFSAAGKRGGVDDKRHLWPTWFELIRQCRPPIAIGEQVASKDGLAWLDTVSADVEHAGYAIGTADLCAAGVGAPHIRQRLFFVAHAVRSGRAEGWAGARGGSTTGRSRVGELANNNNNGFSQQRPARVHAEGTPRHDTPGCSAPSARAVGDAGGDGAWQHVGKLHGHEGEHEERPADSNHASVAAGAARDTWPVGDSASAGPQGCEFEDVSGTRRGGERGGAAGPGPTSGFWADADWIPCRDGRLRPIEPGTFPLADRAPARVGRLRGYGNAIVATLAQEFIETCIEVISER